MEKLKRKLEDAKKAIVTLEEILMEKYSKIVRDATIQRFEYTFEVAWKLLKEYLYHKEGIVCNSPKSCFREAFSVGLLNEEETVLFIQMTDDRNLTSHTYDEEIAENLYKKVKNYYTLLKSLIERINNNLKKL
ncbi:nucleotidyltransferase substrate binding protein, HI0074 family [Thermodesulfobacterium geofontis OPF15]|uniref:Nucleotidyltransferase substrate binding protein, HI0074 family n=1 Tax=Thermodesulfobacterium geofontis (strain OPF15) TaxID=795359 RepID=F8C2H6_THEGP|nr:HI0074 family nucleotidyltransferase substrate-binding subunit [Thermodesulfobacterium geofontis]AEH22266.1 nucleotidyltransferase substrate binding protein, HI0074 family [Thermodesulfobacterium geofontis OPF15]